MGKGVATGIAAVLAAGAIAACGGSGSSGTSTTFTAGGHKFTVSSSTPIDSSAGGLTLYNSLATGGTPVSKSQMPCIVTHLKSAGVTTIGMIHKDASKLVAAVSACKS